MKIENVIYILTNPQYPGYIKIGYASDLKQRLSSLNTGALVEFVPYAVYETAKDKGDLEIHKIIELLNPILRASKFDNGKSKLKEFFKLEPDEAYELLQHIAIVSGTEKHLYKVDANMNKIQNNKTPPDGPPPIPPNQIIPNGIYYFKRKIKRENIIANATIEIIDEKIILKSGSYISPSESKGISDKVKIKRSSLNVVNDTLQEDIQCSSINEASTIILGASCDAWIYWKNENGELIDIYRKEK